MVLHFQNLRNPGQVIGKAVILLNIVDPQANGRIEPLETERDRLRICQAKSELNRR